MTEDTITVTSGSGTDSLTVSDSIYLDLGDDSATESVITSTALPPISLDDIITTSTITLPSPSTFTISGGGGSGSTMWNYGGNYSSSGIYTQSNSNVHIDADGLTMKEGADIKIGSRSLTQSIEKIEERLGILKPNPELEDRWEQLKELRKQYQELEKDLLEKEKIMKILKET
jgi:hypothetical protein